MGEVGVQGLVSALGRLSVVLWSQLIAIHDITNANSWQDFLSQNHIVFLYDPIDMGLNSYIKNLIVQRESLLLLFFCPFMLL